MKLNPFLLLATSLTLAPPALAQNKPVPTPEQVLGHRMGEDRYVPSYDDMMAYWKAVVAVSDRVKLVDIGPSTEGRRQVMAVVSSPENLARLDEYRDTSRALGAAEGIDAARARVLAATGKALVWIDGGLHADENHHRRRRSDEQEKRARHAPAASARAIRERNSKHSARFCRELIAGRLMTSGSRRGSGRRG